MRNIFLQTTLVLLAFNFGLSTVFAASLYLEPQSGTYSEGTSFSIKVRVDNQKECINAGSIILKYPTGRIEAIDVVRGESIFTLWTEDPVIDKEKGEIRFSGGLPGGYCGRIPGDPSLTNVLAEVIFRIPGVTIGKKGADTGEIVFLDSTEILLNDGLGTKAELIVGSSMFRVVPPGQGEVREDWFRSISNDVIKPEEFSVELVRDESVYGGKWFIVFSTLDKQTGIDHFEVYETSIENEGFVVGKKEVASSWKRAKSPYLLEDQSLNSVIRVRAFDKAGNDRIAANIPDESLRKSIGAPISKSLFYIVAGIIAIIFIGGIVFLIYRKLSKKKVSERDTIKERAEEETSSVINPQEKTPAVENEGNDIEGNNQNTTS